MTHSSQNGCIININVNDNKLRKISNFIGIKKLLLFEEINKENLFSWNWIYISNINNGIWVRIHNLCKKNIQTKMSLLKN